MKALTAGKPKAILPIMPASASAPKTVQTLTPPPALCSEVTLEMKVKYMRGSLVIPDGKRNLEFFSALRSLRCDVPSWVTTLSQFWSVMNIQRKEAIISKVGSQEFTLQQLLSAFGIIP